jgi:cell division control protein 6
MVERPSGNDVDSDRSTSPDAGSDDWEPESTDGTSDEPTHTGNTDVSTGTAGEPTDSSPQSENGPQQVLPEATSGQRSPEDRPAEAGPDERHSVSESDEDDTGGDVADGATPDDETTDGATPDDETTDGATPDDETTDGESLDGNRLNGDGAGGNGTGETALDGDDTDGAAHDGEMPEDEADAEGLFDDLLSGEPIFTDKEVLRPAYTPRNLPHRGDQIDNMATILVSALRGDTPSNILIYGKTGTGKTASAKFVSDELEATSEKFEVPCDVEYINCEVTDTQYRVLAQLANKFIRQNREFIAEDIDRLSTLADRADAEPDALADTPFDDVAELEARLESLREQRESFEEVPMTGWPTDRVYSSFFQAIDYRERVVVIMLDEIDKLVEKSGDDTLYNLSRMNADLEHSRVSIIGISNDLKFTDFLDPRVKSSLGEEEIVFPPYDANQLRDILEYRADLAFVESALTDDVIPLCAAFAAQEHGDARRALDLLRTAGELAERDDTDHVTEEHVRQAQEKIEIDRVVEVVRTLPQQSKIVLFAIISLEKQGVHNINTGEVYNVYKQLCGELDVDVLTQRRVTDLISELDMLGIVNAVVVSKGRYGRTKEISLSVPVEETEGVLLTDSRLGDIDDIQPFVQARFDN